MGNFIANPTIMGEKNEILFQFDVSASAFTIGINSVISGSLKWDVSSSVSYLTGNLVKSGMPTSGYTIKCYKGTTSGGKTISYFDLNGLDLSTMVLDVSSLVWCKDFRLSSSSLKNIVFPESHVQMRSMYASNNLFTDLNLSTLHGLGGDIQILNNKFLTNIYLPESSTHVTYFNVSDCSLVTSLDLSNMSGLGGYFYLSKDSCLSSLSFPTSDVSFYSFQILDCSLISSPLDLSGLNKLGGQIYFNNLNVTNIIFPTSHEPITLLRSANGNVSTYHSKLAGVLDVSGLFGLGGTFDVNTNTQLTGILNPESSAAIIAYFVNNCSLGGTLDMSGLSGLGGDIRMQFNPKLNSIINPESYQPITAYQAYSCDVSGTLDLSGLHRLGGTVSLYSNPKLTNVLFDSTSGNISALDIRFCNLSGSIDVSSLNISGSISLGSNPRLTSVFLPNVDTCLNVISINDCSLSGVIDVSMFKNLNYIYLPNNKITNILFPQSTTDVPVSITLTRNDISVNVFDVSMFKNISNLSLGTASSQTNPRIGTILFPPDSSAVNTTIYADYCKLEGTLDLNGLKNLYRLECSFNPNLTGLIGTKSSYRLGLYTFFLNSCNLTGNLDISCLKYIYDQVWLNSNPNLTSVTHADSSLFLRNINSYYIHNCNISGTLDMTAAYPYFTIDFRAYSNPNLTQVIHPDNSAFISSYYVYSTGVTSFDFTNFHNFGGAIFLHLNPKLTEIKMPYDSNRYITQFQVYDTSIMGVLDVSNSLFSGSFQAYNNPNLIGINFNRDSSIDLSDLRIYNCPSLASLKLSNFEKLGSTSTTSNTSYMWVYNNPNLTSVTFPDSSNHFFYFYLNNNNLTGTLDISSLIGLGTFSTSTSIFTIANNPNLTNVIFPSSNYYMATFNCSSCNLLGTIDVSGLSKIGHYSSGGGSIIFTSNKNLTNVLFDVSTSFIQNLIINDCNLTGTLDLRSFKSMVGSIRIQFDKNPSLNDVLLPDVSNKISFLYGQRCNMFNIDLSTYSFNTSAVVDFHGNKNLHNFILGDNSLGQYLYLHDCSLSTSKIDSILQKIASNPIGPTTYQYVSLDEGNNQTPSNGNNNSYIQTIKAYKGSYFKYWINHGITPFLSIPISNRNNTTITLTTWDGSIFDMDSDGGDGLVHTNSLSTSIVPMPTDKTRKFNIYDGSTYGAADVKTFYSYLIDDLSVLNLSALTKLQSVFVETGNALEKIVLPDSSSLSSYRIENVPSMFVTVDISTSSYLSTVIIDTTSVNLIKNPSSLTTVTNYTVNDSSIITLDISSLSTRAASSSTLTLQGNRFLTNILFPTDPSASFSQFNIIDNSISSLDLSSLEYSSNISYVITNNPNLSSIKLPTSTSINMRFFQNNLNGTFDASSVYLYNSADFRVHGNTKLTNILLSTGGLSTFYAHDCSLNGTLDVSSMLTSFGDSYYAAGGIDFRVSNNNTLTSINLHELSYHMRYFLAQNCALDVSTVNSVFRILYNYYSLNNPPSDSSIWLNGGTNASPTDGSSNFYLQMCSSIFNNVSRNFDYKIN